ncbi:hypothetical protein QR680_017598 [Steinernema hermaphroditum]|uniref:ADP/ATP translocase n=1 Tax=Steinernema hermaphroditum TaxID=289476 RepID=A0AA39HF60_9BILA|nr:hypothetical protein QR680_017598 [Steinernema hermaphroditum]
MDEEYEFPMPGMNDAVKFGKDFLAGATAAVVAKTVVAPVERIKLILQLQSAQTTIKAEKRYKGVVDCFVRVPREQGFFSFWRGNLVNIYRSCGQESLGFAFKDFFKIWCLDGVNHNHNYWHFLAGNLAAGGASGAATYCFVYPLDFVRTRLAIDMGRGESREFNGIFDCVRKIVRHDGVFGLYRGFFPSLQYIFLYRGAYYGLFDGTKVLITRSGSDHIGFGYAFLLGQVVTFVAGMISYPLDTVRRRQMMQAGKKEILYRGSWDCTKKIFLNEGPRAFFNGAMVNAIRGTGAALVLAMYNEFAKYM